MSGLWGSLRTMSAALIVAGSLYGVQGARADYAFENAQAAFQSQSLDDRVRLQLLLTAGGYLNSVPMAQFSHHAFSGLQAFQQDNGFAPTGEVENNPDEIVRLRRIADGFWISGDSKSFTTRAVLSVSGCPQISD